MQSVMVEGRSRGYSLFILVLFIRMKQLYCLSEITKSRMGKEHNII